MRLRELDAVLAQNPSAVKAASDPLRYATLRRRAVVLGSLVITAFLALGVFGVWRSYLHAIAITKRELGNVTTALTGQTARSWQNIDLLLSSTASWYQLAAPKMPPEQLDSA